MVLESWQIDFIEVRPRRYGLRYLLVQVEAILGWAAAFTAKGEKASTVAKKQAAIGDQLKVSLLHCTNLSQWTTFSVSDYRGIV